MSVKNYMPSLSQLFSIWEEKSKEFSDEIDVDSYFYHNVFDISQSQHRLARVTKRLQQKTSCIQFVPILRFEDTAALKFREESNILKRELKSLVDNLCDTL